MTDDELDDLEHNHMYYGPSGVRQVVIEKTVLYSLIRANRMFNAMQDSMREFRSDESTGKPDDGTTNLMAHGTGL